MERIIFFGDSITDCNRDYSASIGTENQLGDGYVKQINSELFLKFGYKFQIINLGINGNRSIDLLDRIDDVIKLKPQKVFIMVGINDVWRHFDAKFENILQVDETLFEQSYKKIIQILLNNNIQIYVSSAYYLESNHSNKMRAKLDNYNIITKDLCNKYKIPFLDLQKEMDEMLKSYSSFVFSSDQVHMNYIGNQLLSKKIYKFIFEKETIK